MRLENVDKVRVMVFETLEETIPIEEKVMDYYSITCMQCYTCKHTDD